MFDDAGRIALEAFRSGAQGTGSVLKKGALGFAVGVPTAAAWEGTRRVMSPELYKSKATINSNPPASTSSASSSVHAAPSAYENAKAALAEAALNEALHDIKARSSVL